jgi:hypothetical protein
MMAQGEIRYYGCPSTPYHHIDFLLSACMSASFFFFILINNAHDFLQKNILQMAYGKNSTGDCLNAAFFSTFLKNARIF